MQQMQTRIRASNKQREVKTRVCIILAFLPTPFRLKYELNRLHFKLKKICSIQVTTIFVEIRKKSTSFALIRD